MASGKSDEQVNVRHRLVGAIVLLAIGVILIPMILKGNGPGGIMKSDTLTEEVQEWIVATEDSNTYISRVKAVDPTTEINPQLVAVDPSRAPVLEIIEKQAIKKAQSTIQDADQLNQDVVSAIDKNKSNDTAKKVEVNDVVKQVETTKIASLQPQDVDRGWVVRVGTFSKPENAQSLIASLNQNGFDSRYEVIQTDAGQATRVWVGPYEKRVTAARALETVKEKTGVKGFLKSFP